MGNTWKTTIDNLVGFDPNRPDSNRPKTTWDNPNPRSGEPYSPLPVTYDTVTNENNENWRFPYRFTRRPIGEDSDQGKTIEMLEEQEKRKACIEKLTRDITSSLEGNGYFISPQGEILQMDSEYGHAGYIADLYGRGLTIEEDNQKLEEMLKKGWSRVREGDYEVNVEVADIHNIPPHIEGFLDRYPENIELIIQDSKNKGISLFMEDIHKGLQKAVNKALQRKRMGKKVKLTAGYKSGWLSPEGQFYPLDTDTSHDSWLSANYEILQNYGVNFNPGTRTYTGGEIFQLMEKGWVRLVVYNNEIGIEVANIKKLPSQILDYLSNIDESFWIADLTGRKMDILDPKHFKREIRKQADLPPQQFIPEHLNASTAIQTDDGSIYWSDEPNMIHVQLIKQLGIPVERIVSGGRIVDGTYIDSGNRSDTMRYVEREMAKQRVEQRKTLAKKAGTYSASVPDYLGNEWGNEQRMDNGGEINYVNKDHVDNGYGFRDFNDSSTDYPKPEDIQPAPVHLDILNKPINRTDPFGMTWYSVVLYDAAPMSNGIESVNPD